MVKAQAFTLEVAGLDGADRFISLDGVRLDARLVYDADEDREVPEVKVAPVSIRWKGDGAGRQRGQCRVSVLSSQHEHMRFRVKVSAGDLHCLSKPIRAISKPDNPSQAPAAAAAAPEASEGPQKKRRTQGAPKASLAEEALERTSEAQMEAQHLLRTLQHYSRLAPTAPVVAGGQGQAGQAPEAARARRKQLDFAASFGDLMEAYGRVMDADERKKRVQRASGLLATRAPLHQMKDISVAFGPGGVAMSNSNAMVPDGDLMIPDVMDEEALVSFNRMLVHVQPSVATTTNVIVGDHEFAMLDFEIPRDGCTCNNCIYKLESKQVDSFILEAGVKQEK